MKATEFLFEAVSAASAAAAAAGDPFAELQRTMALICIRDGLASLPHGFHIQDVLLSSFGSYEAAFRSAKASTHFAATKLKKMIHSAEITGFSLVEGKKAEYVAIHIAKLIPDPTPEVRALLPTVVWPDSASSSSSSGFFSAFNTSSVADLTSQPSADQSDPVYSMLDLLPWKTTRVIYQQLGVKGHRAVAG